MMAPNGVSRSAALIGLRLLQFALLFGFNVAAARVLGPAGRGEYVLPATFAAILSTATHLSVESGIGRLLARRELDAPTAVRLTSSGCALVGAVGLVGYAALAVAIRPALPEGVSVSELAIAATGVPLASASFLWASVLLRIGGVVPYGLALAFSAGVQLGTLVLLEVVVGPVTPAAVLAVISGALAVGTGGVALALARRVGWRSLLPMWPGTLGRRALGLGVWLHPTALGAFLIMRLDIVLVGVLIGTAAAGRYSVSTSIAEVAFLVASSLALAGLNRQTEDDDAGAIEYTVQLARFAGLLAVAAASLLAAAAYPLIAILYGSEWTESVVPLIILAFGAIGLAIEGPVRGLLIRLASPSRVSLAAVSVVVLSIILDVLLIPPFGIVGAAIASAIAYWTLAGLMLLVLRAQTGTPVRAVLRPPPPGVIRSVVGQLRRPRASGAAR